MEKAELLLPAGNEECLRAAAANGADAVYLGLSRFNARLSAKNFNESSLYSAVDYCHKRDMKVFVTINTLIKNGEIKEFLEQINTAYCSDADAVIIQDPYLIPLIKRNFPNMSIHLSTQATTVNSYSIPKDADRVILARELGIEEIKSISKVCNTEVFIHGALCLSYNGLCLFSSIAGGRSGNRGRCAQPCRKIYNNKYLLSTKDLCMLEKLPELIGSGVRSLKVEGRMRSPLYVGTAARIYRKYIDAYYEGNFSVDERDIDELKIVFNREFTTGFAYNSSIAGSIRPSNRGLYIGRFTGGILRLKRELKKGDGISIEKGEEREGYNVKKIVKGGRNIDRAYPGDEVIIDTYKEERSVFKTFSIDLKADMGDEIKHIESKIVHREFILPPSIEIRNDDSIRIFAKAYNKRSAIALDRSKADVIYYDILKEDCKEVKEMIKNSKFFVYTPWILSDKDILMIKDRIDKVQPDGVMAGNRGLLKVLDGYEVHTDYSFNCINDIDISCCKGVPIISPELNFKELKSLKNKNFIVLVHGDIILMTTKEPIRAPELIDCKGRHFKVRRSYNTYQILNSSQIGLFSKSRLLADAGVRYFYIDSSKEADKFVRIYRKILSGKEFDDRKISRGYTTGHFRRGVE